MSQASPAVMERRRNSALWIGTALLLLAVLSNVPSLYVLKVPGVGLLPWISLLLPAIGVVFFVVGLKRAFGQPQVFRGKVVGSILTVVSVLFFALSVWFFLHLRAVPASTGAPKVGQKAPGFTLTNTSGQSVTLAQLLATPIDAASGKAPKAVLLIFYRGYW